MLHISGVADPDVPVSDMEDGLRGLVDHTDRLDSVAQIGALFSQGLSRPRFF